MTIDYSWRVCVVEFPLRGLSKVLTSRLNFFNILEMFQFTTSKAVLDIYLEKESMQVASRISERLKT